MGRPKICSTKMKFCYKVVEKFWQANLDNVMTSQILRKISKRNGKNCVFWLLWALISPLSVLGPVFGWRFSCASRTRIRNSRIFNAINIKCGQGGPLHIVKIKDVKIQIFDKFYRIQDIFGNRLFRVRQFIIANSDRVILTNTMNGQRELIKNGGPVTQ